MYIGFRKMFTKYPHAIVMTRKIFITFHRTITFSSFLLLIFNVFSIFLQKSVEWSLLIILETFFKSVKIFLYSQNGYNYLNVQQVDFTSQLQCYVISTCCHIDLPNYVISTHLHTLFCHLNLFTHLHSSTYQFALN